MLDRKDFSFGLKLKAHSNSFGHEERFQRRVR